jgi:hypothetical protein
MRIRKDGLTVAQRRAMAGKLRGIHDKLLGVAGELRDAYPLDRGQSEAAEQARQAVAFLAARLDQSMPAPRHKAPAGQVYHTQPPQPAEPVQPWWSK